MSGSIGGRAAKVTRKVNPPRVFVKTPAAQIGDGPTGVSIVSAATNENQPSATLTAGSSSVAGSASTTWLGQSAGFAVCAVKVIDGVGGSTSISIGTPSLSGCGMTWSLAGGPYAGHATGSPDVYDQLCIFTGTGSIADGTLTFNIGTSANARNLAIRGIISAFSNVDAIVETVHNGPTSTGATASASLSDPRGNGATIAVGGYTVTDFSGTLTPDHSFLAGTGGNKMGGLTVSGNQLAPAFEFSSLDVDSTGQNLAWLTQVSALS